MTTPREKFLSCVSNIAIKICERLGFDKDLVEIDDENIEFGGTYTTLAIFFDIFSADVSANERLDIFEIGQEISNILVKNSVFNPITFEISFCGENVSFWRMLDCFRNTEYLANSEKYAKYLAYGGKYTVFAFYHSNLKNYF